VEQPIRFDNNEGETLAGTLNQPESEPAFGVVLGHCFTCSRHTAVLRQIARDLEASGNAALRFDFSGNGQSEGIFSESTYSKQISEMTAAVELLKDRGVGRIGLAGHSLGAVVAMLTAFEMPDVMGVCCLGGRLTGMSPFEFLDRRQKEQVQRSGRVSFTSRGRELEITRDFFADADRYPLAEIVAALKPPLLVIHGDQDAVVPLAEAERASELKPQGTELAVIRGADHMFSREDDRIGVARLVVDWFLRRAAAGADL
jgi:putative redox protein